MRLILSGTGFFIVCSLLWMDPITRVRVLVAKFPNAGLLRQYARLFSRRGC